MVEDTIVAISSAYGKGAVSIIRLSGADALKIAGSVFIGNDISKTKSHTISYGRVKDPVTGSVLDEVLVSVFRAPRSFTREDVVEIGCHGGVFVTNRILELLLQKGARLSEPGEFTKRAFLNGRIDLTQAEAVMDIIEAKSMEALHLANQGLLGEVRKLVVGFRSEILSVIAMIEVNIDYPEYDDAIVMTSDIIKPIVVSMIEKMNSILEKADTVRIIREGIKTAIIGRPNVGKSSLLNALLREDRAIVTEIAGTTRDTVEGTLQLGGLTLHLVDTAGIRTTSDQIEKIGVERSRKMIAEAEIILLVLDNSVPLDETDIELLKMSNGKNRIVIVNKVDLDSKIDASKLNDVVMISATKEGDIKILEEKIRQLTKINEFNPLDATLLGNARHVSKMKEARKSLMDSLASIENKMPVDVINVDLTAAWNRLGEIIGEDKGDALLNELFAKFCLGK
jgi:tRNA modification GTPase